MELNVHLIRKYVRRPVVLRNLVMRCDYPWIYLSLRPCVLQNPWKVLPLKIDKTIVLRRLRVHIRGQLIDLLFLPPEHIEETFLRLDGRAPKVFAPVMDYLYRTWIHSSIFKIHHWSVFMTYIRTNNDVKGYHNRLNTSVATRGSMPFYHLLIGSHTHHRSIEDGWCPKARFRDTRGRGLCKWKVVFLTNIMIRWQARINTTIKESHALIKKKKSKFQIS